MGTTSRAKTRLEASTLTIFARSGLKCGTGSITFPWRRARLRLNQT